jgi:hypothetical protein
MTTPIDEKSRPQYPTGSRNAPGEVPAMQASKSSEDEGTVVGDGSVRQDSPERNRMRSHLTVDPQHNVDTHDMYNIVSPSRTRAEETQLTDELRLLQIEQQVEQDNATDESRRSKSLHRSRSRRAGDPIDEFDAATNPLHESTNVYKPPEKPNTSIGKIFKKIHQSSVIIRWAFYITPLTLILLIPLLLGALQFKNAQVGGVKLVWFSIWLEIVWLTLWAGRVSIPKNLVWKMGC